MPLSLTYSNFPPHRKNHLFPCDPPHTSALFAREAYSSLRARRIHQFIPILIKISILNPHWNIFPNKFHFKDSASSYDMRLHTHIYGTASKLCTTQNTAPKSTTQSRSGHEQSILWHICIVYEVASTNKNLLSHGAATRESYGMGYGCSPYSRQYNALNFVVSSHNACFCRASVHRMYTTETHPYDTYKQYTQTMRSLFGGVWVRSVVWVKLYEAILCCGIRSHRNHLIWALWDYKLI